MYGLVLLLLLLLVVVVVVAVAASVTDVISCRGDSCR